MKICSFAPAATYILYELGLENLLDGITFECPGDKPRVVNVCLEGQTRTSHHIYDLVAAQKEKKNLCYVDMEQLHKIKPDVIITQHTAHAYQIGPADAEEIGRTLPHKPQIVSLDLQRLADVPNSVLTLASYLGKEEEGHFLKKRIQERLDGIHKRLQAYHARQRKVMVMEGLDPVYNCGRWIPDQIKAAGGIDLLSNPGELATPLSWETVLKYDPEVLVIAPPHFSVDQTREEIKVLTGQDGWEDLQAVRNEEVYIVHAHYFAHPGPTLVDGVEMLATLFHPDLFEVPQKVNHHQHGRYIIGSPGSNVLS